MATLEILVFLVTVIIIVIRGFWGSRSYIRVQKKVIQTGYNFYSV